MTDNATTTLDSCAGRLAIYASSLQVYSMYKPCSIISALGAIKDSATGKSVNASALSNYCDGITAGQISSSTTPSSNPSSDPSRPTSSVAVISTSHSSTIIIVACVAVGIVAILVIAFIYVRTKRNTRDSFMYVVPPPATIKTAPSTVDTTASNESGSLDMCNLDMHRLLLKDVTMIKVLASGAFGEVWMGQYEAETVAVKKLLPHKFGKDALQKFIYEIALMAKLDSPYIVQFLGAAWTRPTDIILVTEFMDGGDLRNRLQNGPPLSWQQKLQVALDISEGLVYLHTLNPTIIHRDLKSRNVLLNSKSHAKITDFGVSRETDDSTMTAGIGTYRWMAPEVLHDGHYSESADVFSYGVIMAELSTELLPYSDLKNPAGNPYTDTALMTKVMTGDLRPTFSNDCPTWFQELGMLCMNQSALDRPSAMTISYQIKTELRKQNSKIHS
ncbi:kinase [Thraustotheca clavata]|uniref:Kinase n=1 Tax=Thraustotheca clavata TaxID=74557 RepID=A0A1V9Y732_9STRA|nr:kinase [Thraustotheca clavata]